MLKQIQNYILGIDFKRIGSGLVGWGKKKINDIYVFDWKTNFGQVKENIRKGKMVKMEISREDVRDFFKPPEGNLPWKRVFKIAYKNLIKGKSRMMVTMGGVSVGVGAIVLLVSFGYGLQSMVTKKIIWPEALRVADVASETSGVKINKESVDKVAGVDKVVKVEPVIRLAGNLNFSGSQIDAVVAGSRADYLHLSNIKMLAGKIDPKVFDQQYQGEKGDLEEAIKKREGEGMVAGVSSEDVVINLGDEIEKKQVDFKIKEDSYVVVYGEPKLTGEVFGFAKGSILSRYVGKSVWGGVYSDVGGQGKTVAENGQIMGKWIKAKFKLWQKMEDGFYFEKGEEKEGFINMDSVLVLSPNEVLVEELLDSGVVLGEATSSGEASATAAASLSSLLTATDGSNTASEAAGLIQMLSDQDRSEVLPEAEELKVRSEGEKKLLVSSALLRVWNKKEDEILGKTVELQYLVSGNLLDRAIGRLVSEKVKYVIDGVFEDKNKPMVYVPLSDVESMGVANYSGLKVLVKSEADLAEVRSIIQTQGLVTRSVADTLGQINRLFAIVRFLLGAFGSIALVVALFGMFNTMTVSLLERTREIGVMKSLGTSNLDVVRIFLTEAGLISIVGSVGGVVLGLILGKIIDGLVFRYSSDGGMFVLPLIFAFGVILAAVGVGVMTGMYPSRRASRISAMDALRYE